MARRHRFCLDFFFQGSLSKLSRMKMVFVFDKFGVVFDQAVILERLIFIVLGSNIFGDIDPCCSLYYVFLELEVLAH